MGVPPERTVAASPFPSWDPQDPLLRQATEYVSQFEQTFSSVIWRERYEQTSRRRRQFSTTGATFSAVTARRSLESELFLVWLPRDSTWLAVRDVMTVDGRARDESERRLQSVLAGPSISAARLRQLAASNGQFNVGRIVHTFNEPTLALLFLGEHYRPRFSFDGGGSRRLNGRTGVAYEFVERVRPTVIQDHDRDVAARGTLWLESGSGRVLQTELELQDAASQLHGRMTVRYGPDSKFDVLVPLEMRETYTSAAGEEVTTTATYTDFRRFETGARLIDR